MFWQKYFYLTEPGSRLSSRSGGENKDTGVSMRGGVAFSLAPFSLSLFSCIFPLSPAALS